MATQALRNQLGVTRHSISIGAPCQKVLGNLVRLQKMARHEGLQVVCGKGGWVRLRRDYQVWE